MNTPSSQTKVAIIGLGKIGQAIAYNLRKGNHQVILAARHPEKAKALADELGAPVVAREIKDAILEADVIIPAIYFNSIKEFLATFTKELAGKIIVDVSNPIAPDGKGGFQKIIGQSESAGKTISALIPESAKLVKAFGTLGAASLANAAFDANGTKVLFYASDNINSNQQIEELITSSGFAPLHIGGIDQSLRIEVFGDLHEFGGLGAPVTMAEAKTKLQTAVATL